MQQFVYEPLLSTVIHSYSSTRRSSKGCCCHDIIFAESWFMMQAGHCNFEHSEKLYFWQWKYLQCVREPFLSPSSILIPAPVGQAVEGCRRQGGGDFGRLVTLWQPGSRLCSPHPYLPPSPPPDFHTFLRPCDCEGYCCCHGLIMQNHGPWCKEEEKGSLVKNQSEFMHLWPWMEILTTEGAKRDENYTLPCY